MKIISWNVNGLRACIKKGFPEFFKQADADIFCIQETKMDKGLIEQSKNLARQGSSLVMQDFEQAGTDLINQESASPPNPAQYKDYWNSAEKKGYSGTAVFTKIMPLSEAYGIGIDEHDFEGRVITLEFEWFYLVNVYTPNSQRELTRLDYRMSWEDAFRRYVCRLDKVKPVIICGDLNVAHNPIDLKNAKSNEGNAGYTRQERDKLTRLLDAGFTDFFRHLYPDRKEAYTWWSYIGKSREKNTGWRIDYFLGSKRLTGKVGDVIIYSGILGSDHCPIGLEIDV